MARTAGVRRLPALVDFENWTPPWKDGEFDAEKAKKLIYDLHQDKETLFKEIDKKDSEIADLEDEADELETKVREATKPESQPKEGENAEIAALRREIESLKGDKEKPLTRREKREQAAKDAEREPSGDSLLAEKYRIALEKGLSVTAARRLQGSTVEEIEADADVYLAEHGSTGKAGGEQSGGKGGQAPPSQRPKVKPKTGTVADEAEDEILDPGKLYDEVVGTN